MQTAETTNHINQDTDRLLRNIFHQMLEAIDDVRTRNLISRNIKDYTQAEEYLNDKTLIYKWHGAGQQSVERVSCFLQEFFRECQLVVSGQKEGTATMLTAIDYPFLTDEEKDFLVSFLQTEGRYPVLFIASRYLQRTTNRQAQVFARANGIVGGHQRLEVIGQEYGLSRERVRQLGVMSILDAEDASLVWDMVRWQSIGFLRQPLLTESNIGWATLRQKEHLGDMDFYGALAIIRQMVPLNIVALRADGRRANARLTSDTPWQMPDVLFAYDKRLACFSFENALAVVGHEASLQCIKDRSMSLTGIVDRHFVGKHSEEDRQSVISVMRAVLPLFSDVETEGDDIVLRANRLNYADEIYRILQRRGEAMPLNAIYEEFRLLHPDDHHTDNSFIRNYMLRDERFEAVGSKSTYQLREWERFAGSLGDLAFHLLETCDEPIRVDTLCQRMLQMRPTTTLKSCETSAYLAVTARRLLYYIDNTVSDENDTDEADDETTDVADGETGRYYVGLFDRQYPGRFWPSPLTVDGAVRSLRRFVTEYGRWPFASAKTGVEHKLYYVMRKYAYKRCVSDDELQRYQQGMADVSPDDYPASERDLQFQRHCCEVSDYCARHHHLPLSGKLLSWYQSQCSQADQLTGFRKYQFRQLQLAVASSHQELPVIPIRSGSHHARQLSLEFSDDDT